MSRLYPALDVDWSRDADDDMLARVLVEIDDVGPVAIQERARGAVIFFGDDAARDAASVRLHDTLPACRCEPLSVPDDDWAARSQAALQPVFVDRVVVAPPWASTGPWPSDTTAVIIQPSMGFGTGHHATTRLCLQLLQQRSIAGDAAIDIGTGSGVLAIAAAKLGAIRVLAIDNDPDALMSTRENVALNDVAALVTVEQRDLNSVSPRERPEGGFDLLLANLTGGLLTRTAPQIGALLAPAGRAIVSGILDDEEEGVRAAFERAGLVTVQVLAEQEWRALELHAR